MVDICNEDWTADVVGRMHKFRITNQMLAERAGFCKSYISTVLNGKKPVRSACKEATKHKILAALAEIEAEIEGKAKKDAGQD